MVDITARKQTEAILGYQDYVLENLAEGVNYVDEQGLIRFTNPAFDAMFGYDRGELIGQPVTVLNDLPKAESEKLVSEIVQALKVHGRYEGEFQSLRKDGSSFITWAKIQNFVRFHVLNVF